ncbi:MAG: hypothetical protein ACR2PL_08105, partial [Dehalococcoidia bacterium]
MTPSHALPQLPNLTVGDELPASHATAHNPSTASDNLIHEDETAKRYGFRGGLVPGVIDYAYMAAPLAAALGERWLTRGEATVSLIHPLYEGEPATARARVTAVEPLSSGRRIVFDAWVENPEGQRCAAGTATVSDVDAAESVEAPEYVALDPGSPPEPRPELLLESAPVGALLARRVTATTVETARQYAEMVEDANPLFQAGSSYGPPLMHPGWLLGECNSIFTLNYRFGPWIHTRSDIQYLGPALAGRIFTLHGRLTEAYERRLHHYATLDLFCTDDTGK